MIMTEGGIVAVSATLSFHGGLGQHYIGQRKDGSVFNKVSYLVFYKSYFPPSGSIKSSSVDEGGGERAVSLYSSHFQTS